MQNYMMRIFFFFFSTGRKHCWKRRKCCLPAFSPFSTMFSEVGFLWVVKTQVCAERVNMGCWVKNGHCRPDIALLLFPQRHVLHSQYAQGGYKFNIGTDSLNFFVRIARSVEKAKLAVAALCFLKVKEKPFFTKMPDNIRKSMASTVSATRDEAVLAAVSTVNP